MAYGVLSNDTDTLAFGSHIFIRIDPQTSNWLTADIEEISLTKILNKMNLKMDEFIDMCILLGCDFTETMTNVGQIRAIRFIRNYGKIKQIIAKVDPNMYKTPKNWEYQEVRQLFSNPTVTDPHTLNLQWRKQDSTAMSNFLSGCNKWFDKWQIKKPTTSDLSSKFGRLGGSNESVDSITSTSTNSSSSGYSSSTSGGGTKRKSDATDENDTQKKQNWVQSSL